MRIATQGGVFVLPTCRNTLNQHALADSQLTTSLSLLTARRTEAHIFELLCIALHTLLHDLEKYEVKSWYFTQGESRNCNGK